MKIFADYHHSGLYASLVLLLEGRLGNELYRPIGMDWFEKDYWKIAEPYGNNPNTAKQFLEPHAIPTDGTPPLNNEITKKSGYISIEEKSNNVTHKAITLSQLVEMNPDFIIASIPAHVTSFKRLIKDYNLKSKLLYQVGNIGWHTQIPWGAFDGLMATVAPFHVPANEKAVFYRQEFDLEVFKPGETRRNRNIFSFVNLLPEAQKFDALRRALPNYSFRSYGIGCTNGILTSTQQIAKFMRGAEFGYHNKPGGDGYGHIIHNWFAIGRPVIINLDDYKDKLAGELLTDGETCINMSGRSSKKVAEIINNLSDLEYMDMCSAVTKRFEGVVDFAEDAARVGEFLDACL